MSDKVLDTCRLKAMVLTGTATVLLLVACNGDSVKPGMTEKEVVRLMGKPTASFGEKTKFGGFLDDNDKCRAKLVKVMLYDRSSRKDVIVGINGEGVVECVETADGVAVTNFHN